MDEVIAQDLGMVDLDDAINLYHNRSVTKFNKKSGSPLLYSTGN